MPKFLRRTLLLMITAAAFTGLRAQNNFWQTTSESGFARSGKRAIAPTSFGAYKLDTTALLSALTTAPTEFTEAAKNNPLVITLPMPDGTTERFSIVYSPIMEPELQAKFPNIRTYSGQGIDDKTTTIRMDWTEFGFHAQVRSVNANKAFYIDPYAQGEKTQYMSYRRQDLPRTKEYMEGVVEEQMAGLTGLAQRTNAGICLGSTLRTYRAAVACTHQYATAVGATTIAQALSAIVTTMNRVTGIYESELSVRLVLIANENLIIFPDAASDPFTGNDVATTLIAESQTQITNRIGTANFDIGHTFSTGAGGLAGLGVVCNPTQKARGVTGSTLPVGDAYDVDFVAHEMGHQFGGNHTFNATTSNCGGGNRSVTTSVEPGSGITIMAYAGICTTNDLAAHSIPYFHTISQLEIGTYITTGTGSTCGTTSNTGDIIPVVNAGADYTIPFSTPFMLTGSATDGNNSEVLTYSWEEFDNGAGANWNSGAAPFFRSFTPSLSATRTFPQMSDIIAGTTTRGEFLPSTAQSLNFRLTARDNRPNGGGSCSDDMILNVSGTNGPFTVTSQNTATAWTAGNTATITWNVAGTNAAPFNATNVSILFSADGGYTYPYTLVASTPNNGTANITIPSLKTGSGRVMVKAIGNVFFNINTGNISISSSCAAEGAVVSPATPVAALYGTAPLNLSLAPQFSTVFAPSSSIVNADPVTSLSLYTTATSTCDGPYCNMYKYKTFQFVVSQTGSYTFNRSGAGSVFGIYYPVFDPGNLCTNVVANNWSGGTLASFSANLTAGQAYTLVIGVYTGSSSGSGGCTDQAFNTSASNTLPFAFSISVTPPAGGAIYNGTAVYTNPGGSFNYAYVVVNNATNNIVSIGGTNLTNSATYPIGQYTIYGLSYANSIANLNTYVGGSFANFANQIMTNPSTFCANLSKNTVTVNVTGTFTVQFTELKARKRGETVALDWGTVTEQNSSHFIVQRSSNGSNFEKEIGTVKAAGNSSSELKYDFVDVAPLKGWNYYRIKQVDVDGKYIYSNTAAVNFEKGNGLMVIYPNPAKDQLNVEYTTERSGKLELQVIDSKGAVLMARKMNVTTGRNIESMNISSLSQGMYLLKYVDTDGNISFSKFIKQ
jgi:hypothetical protein